MGHSLGQDQDQSQDQSQDQDQDQSQNQDPDSDPDPACFLAASQSLTFFSVENRQSCYVLYRYTYSRAATTDRFVDKSI